MLARRLTGPAPSLRSAPGGPLRGGSGGCCTRARAGTGGPILHRRRVRKQPRPLAIDPNHATAADTIPALHGTTSDRSIAVLPFSDMSPERDQEYLADGIAEEIINALTRIGALRVAARTSSFAFKGRNEDVGQIGRKLKVSTILGGSVRKAGNRLRVTAQLVNATDGYQLWSERYDRELADVFAVEDEIAGSVVGALAIVMGGNRRTG